MLLLRYCVTSKSCPKPLAHVIPCCILIVPIFFTSNRSIFLYIWNKLSFFQPIFVQFIHAFVAVLCDKQVMSTAPGACEHVFSRGRAAIWSARRVMASTEMHMQNAGYFSKPASRMVSCFCYLVRVTDSTSSVCQRLARLWPRGTACTFFCICRMHMQWWCRSIPAWRPWSLSPVAGARWHQQCPCCACGVHCVST